MMSFEVKILILKYLGIWKILCRKLILKNL